MKFKLSDVVDINPKESLKKGIVAKKIAMDMLKPNTRDIPSYEKESYSGGVKFRKGDTIMARITPCLENGKIAQVNILEEDEIGFGSTEYIVFRAKSGITDKDFVYYLVTSPIVRGPAIKSMVGSSGRQRVQVDVVKALELDLPDIDNQRKIASILKSLDDKIELNNRINRNLSEQAFTLFDKMYVSHNPNDIGNLSELADINPKRTLVKNAKARCIDMAKLSTSGAFPDGWEYKPYTGGMKFINGDTLLARITPCLENGKAAYVNFLDENETAFGSTEYIVMASKGSVPSEMLYCLARYPKFVDYAVKNMNGSSGRQRVSGEIIGQYQIPQFSETELKAFGESVKDFFEVMKFNLFENLRLIELRDSLLTRLMSGELDVSNIEI